MGGNGGGIDGLTGSGGEVAGDVLRALFVEQRGLWHSLRACRRNLRGILVAGIPANVKTVSFFDPVVGQAVVRIGQWFSSSPGFPDGGCDERGIFLKQIDQRISIVPMAFIP